MEAKTPKTPRAFHISFSIFIVLYVKSGLNRIDLEMPKKTNEEEEEEEELSTSNSIE